MKNFRTFKIMAMIAIAAVTMSMAAVAQEKGDKAIGGNFVLGSGDSYSNIGVGANFRYNILRQLRGEASFTYFLKKDYLTMWDASVNAHYLFPLGDRLTVYPLAGAGFLGYSYGSGYGYGGLASHSDLAINLGGGVDIQLAGSLYLNAEAKYKISDYWDRLLLSAGLSYRF